MLLVTIIMLTILYPIYRYRDILLWLRDSVSINQYSVLINRLLSSNGNNDETYELLIDFIYFMRGSNRNRPIRYVGNDITCPITMDTISTGDTVLILPCGHMGKYDAMHEWLSNNNVCPICRVSY